MRRPEFQRKDAETRRRKKAKKENEDFYFLVLLPGLFAPLRLRVFALNSALFSDSLLVRTALASLSLSTAPLRRGSRRALPRQICDLESHRRARAPRGPTRPPAERSVSSLAATSSSGTDQPGLNRRVTIRAMPVALLNFARVPGPATHTSPVRPPSSARKTRVVLPSGSRTPSNA